MQLFGIKPYRRTTPKLYKKPKDSVFPNLLLTETPRPPPRIIHSDQGSEYASMDYINLVQSLKIKQSMSAPGCPWENGYQESFYKGFKLDIGDPNRFATLGELVAAVYQTINNYNQKRIHSALKLLPAVFA